ncbi:MAG: hypothetical protein AABY27_07500 [Pseudomonadota bacterium]
MKLVHENSPLMRLISFANSSVPQVFCGDCWIILAIPETEIGDKFGDEIERITSVSTKGVFEQKLAQNEI